jgi:hypothetical protein
MPHYYFDVGDGNHLAVDDDGFKLPNIACVQREATRSLVEIGRDAVRSPGYDGSINRRMAIEVRNESGPVLQVTFTFEVARLGGTLL